MKLVNLMFFTLFIFTACHQEKTSHLELQTNPGTPTLVGDGLISTNLYERDIAIAADGKMLMYTLGDQKQNRRCLVSMKESNGKWSAPAVWPFSGKYQDIEPFLSVDGQQLFFASNRPLSQNNDRSDYNIWVSQLVNEEWQSPEPLSELINTEGDEFYPSVSQYGHLYFTASRGDGIGREDIFKSELVNGIYQQPVVLDSAINSAVYEFNAYITPDESMIIFSSFGRTDGMGGGDLYLSKKNGEGRWTTAINLGPGINSDKLDYCPFIDIPRNNFYFTSERIKMDTLKIMHTNDLLNIAHNSQNGFGDIYYLGMKSLEEKLK